MLLLLALGWHGIAMQQPAAVRRPPAAVLAFQHCMDNGHNGLLCCRLLCQQLL